jgi:hypothetical protein
LTVAEAIVKNRTDNRTMADNVNLIKKTLTRKNVSDQNPLEYGKLPPQSKDLEEAVLGASHD